MDWSKQMQETIKTWTDSQQRILEGITNIMLEMAAPPSTNPWEFSIDLWEKGVKGFLATQNDWTRLWIRGVSAVTNQPDNSEWAQRIQQMTKLTLEFEEQFWQGWFTTLKQLDPIKNANVINELKPLTEAWSANVQRGIQLQEEWLQSAVNTPKA
jgi:hypothetical protein